MLSSAAFEFILNVRGGGRESLFLSILLIHLEKSTLNLLLCWNLATLLCILWISFHTMAIHLRDARLTYLRDVLRSSIEFIGETGLLTDIGSNDSGTSFLTIIYFTATPLVFKSIGIPLSAFTFLVLPLFVYLWWLVIQHI